MQAPVYKAVSRPPQVFWAPMFPAILNFVIQIAIMIIVQGIFPGQVDPDVFITSFLIVHVGLIIWGQKEPHLSGILLSQNMIRSHWTQEGELKDSQVLIPVVFEENSVRYKEGFIARVFRLNKSIQGVTNWRQWLTDLDPFKVEARVVVSNAEFTHIILSVGEEKALEQLNEATQGVRSMLGDFDPVLLSAADAKMFLEKELKGGVRFSKNNSCLILGNHQEYMTSVSIVSLGDQMDSRMFEEILSAENEIKIQHGIKFVPNDKAVPLLVQQRKMAFFTTFSQQVYEQYTTVLDKLSHFQEFPEILCYYSINIFVTARSVAELNQSVRRIRAVLDKYRFRSIRDNALNQVTFLTQFPVCRKYPRVFLCPSETISVALSAVKQSSEKYKWGATF